MRAMVLEHGGRGAQLHALERPVPAPMGQDVLLRVLACGVCRTDLHLLDDLRRHSHERLARHAIFPAVGGTQCALGSQPDPHWRICALGALTAPPCWYPAQALRHSCQPAGL